MNSDQFPALQTERLLLRRPNFNDWEMIAYLRSDKEVNKFVKRPAAKTKQQAQEFISKINNGIDKQELLYWVITEKADDEMLGSICLWKFSSDRKTAEVGYDLNPVFQGEGIMNECLQSIMEFGFQKLDLDRIEAYTQKNNEPSKRLLEKNNFQLVVGKIDENNLDNLIYEIKKGMNP